MFVVVACNYQPLYVLRLEDTTYLRVNRGVASPQIIVSGGMTHSGMTMVGSTTQRCGQYVNARVYIDAMRGERGVGAYKVVIDTPPE